MNVDSPEGQNCIAKWSLLIGTAACLTTYFVNYWITLGIIFGMLLMLVNWRVLSKIIRIAFNIKKQIVAKVVAFFGYHIRFWIVVLIMFLVIPKTNMYFGIGTFLGFLIPKVVMATIVIKSKTEEWWTTKFPPQNRPEKPLTYIEKELQGKDPFAVDLVELEIKRYNKKLKGEL